jgi:hypothetical protein
MALGFAPCCFTKFEVELEDDGEITHEDKKEPQLAVKEATASVSSEGLQFDNSPLKTLTGVDGGFTVSGVVKRQLDDVAGGLGASGELDKIVRQVSGEELIYHWTDIDMLGDQPKKWLEHQVARQGTQPLPSIVEVVSIQTNTYRFKLKTPEAYYDSRTRVVFEADPEHFPTRYGSQEPTDSERITLKRIQTQFEPPYRYIDNEGEYTFEVSVEHSIDPDIGSIALDPPVGKIMDVAAEGDGTFEVTYKTPAQLPDDFEVQLSTKAKTNTGIFRPFYNPPERIGAATISAQGSVQIQSPLCADLGENIRVSTSTSPADAKLDWSIPAGRILSSTQNNQSIKYKMPTEYDKDYLEIVAEHGPSSAKESVKIHVGGCDRYAYFQGGGVSWFENCEPPRNRIAQGRPLCWAFWEGIGQDLWWWSAGSATTGGDGFAHYVRESDNLRVGPRVRIFVSSLSAEHGTFPVSFGGTFKHPDGNIIQQGIDGQGIADIQWAEDSNTVHVDFSIPVTRRWKTPWKGYLPPSAWRHPDIETETHVQRDFLRGELRVPFVQPP